MLDQDKILNFLRITGPTFPSRVAKNINTDTLIASAHLSDLISQGKVKISNLKVGGSPLYFLPGHEDQLYKFAAGNINPKDFQVLEKLKQDKILRENALDLLSKVSLRSLKDFAIPLHVTVEGQKELFWKWHLLSDEETKEVIASLLFSRNSQQAPSKKMEAEFAPVQQSIVEPQPNYPEKKEDETHDSYVATEDQLTLFNRQEEKIPALEKKSSKAKVRAPRKKKAVAPNVFISELKEYLAELSIVIDEQEILLKSTEITLLVKVPSVVGRLTYYCKAKKKARCDERDLAAAYMEAQMKRLPLLFLYTQELTKKAQEMLDSGTFENAVVKKINGPEL